LKFSRAKNSWWLSCLPCVCGAFSSLCQESSGWAVAIKGIPQDEGFPVELHIDGQKFYESSGEDESDVTYTVETTGEMKEKEQIEVSLKIPILATTITRTFKKVDGLFVKFEIRAEGLAILQSLLGT
jgi:hypothetical protein